MEYLMTYGWAILVIAVVLSVLFELGLFSGKSLSTSACIATPAYLCAGAIYSYSDANIIVTIGQERGLIGPAQISYSYRKGQDMLTACLPYPSIPDRPTQYLRQKECQAEVVPCFTFR